MSTVSDSAESSSVFDRCIDEAKNYNSLLKLGMIALKHPLEYARVLIQIGHEPIAPKQGTKLFSGTPVLIYPSVFKYVGYIKKRDGFLGLYSGLFPKLLETKLDEIISKKVSDRMDVKYGVVLDILKEEEEEEMDEEKRKDLIIKATVRKGLVRAATITVIHPLHVICIRSMAQFVGKETKYNGIFSSISSVLEENGIMGFWSGLLPRIAGELSVISLTAFLTYLANTYIVEDKKIKKYTGDLAGLFAHSICYPFTVVSNTMIVSRSGLIAGYPPCMPFYSSTMDCYKSLSKNNQLKRGSSLFIRYYTGPSVTVGGRALPLNPSVYVDQNLKLKK